jgi:lysophospholipase L1-like esterase
MQPLNMNKKFGNGIIFLISILLSLVFVEFILRLPILKKNKAFPKAPQFIKNYRPSPHILLDGSILYVGLAQREFLTFGYKFRNNRWGFREKELTQKKNKNIFRILVFGDSFTFGVGIDDNHRYTNSLEEMLKIENINSEVLSFGMGGYSTDQEHDLMKIILENVECDLVIIGFCCDDLSMTTKKKLRSFTNVEKISKEDRVRLLNQNNKLTFNNFRNISTIPLDEPKEFSKARKWYQKTNIYKFFEIRTNINLEAKLPNSARWKYALNEFKGIKGLTQKHNLPPPIALLLNYGFVDSKKNNFKNPKGELAQNIHLYNFVGNELKKEGFHIVDTLPLFKKYSGMTMATSEWEHHPNYLGHYIYAKSTKDYLLSNNLIPNRFKKN